MILKGLLNEKSRKNFYIFSRRRPLDRRSCAPDQKEKSRRGGATDSQAVCGNCTYHHAKTPRAQAWRRLSGLGAKRQECDHLLQVSGSGAGGGQRGKYGPQRPDRSAPGRYFCALETRSHPGSDRFAARADRGDQKDFGQLATYPRQDQKAAGGQRGFCGAVREGAKPDRIDQSEDRFSSISSRCFESAKKRAAKRAELCASSIQCGWSGRQANAKRWRLGHAGSSHPSYQYPKGQLSAGAATKKYGWTCTHLQRSGVSSTSTALCARLPQRVSSRCKRS